LCGPAFSLHPQSYSWLFYDSCPNWGEVMFHCSFGLCS
jgi:hypothetical protein